MASQDKVVATLFVLAAVAVKSDRRADDYWQVERRWLAGDSARVMDDSRARVKLDRLAPGA